MGNLKLGLKPPTPILWWQCHRCPRCTSLGYQPLRIQPPDKSSELRRLWTMKPASWLASHLSSFKKFFCLSLKIKLIFKKKEKEGEDKGWKEGTLSSIAHKEPCKEPQLFQRWRWDGDEGRGHPIRCCPHHPSCTSMPQAAQICTQVPLGDAACGWLQL